MKSTFFPFERHYRSHFSSCMPLTAPLFRLDAVNAANFPVKCREHHFFDWTPLTPVFFRLSAFNSATFQVKGHEQHFLF